MSLWGGWVLAVVGTVVLWGRVEGGGSVAVGVYGGSLVVLFGLSAGAHSAMVSQEVSAGLVRLDYAAIFVLIAGTYTPICVLGIGGWSGWGVLAAQWVLAGLGVWLVMTGRCRSGERVVMYVVMGWLGLVVAGDVVRGVGWSGVGWLVGGGVVYTLGAVVFVTDKPRLWPGVFVAHDLWHATVLTGAAMHWWALRGGVEGGVRQ